MGTKEKTKQHFEDTAADYNNSHDGRFVEPMYEALLKEVRKTQSGRILDVGCGNGNLFSLLPERRYELFGIDFSENMIAEARKKCGDKAAFSVADAEELPFEDDTFDLVVCNASFHHYIHPDTVAAEMHRVLKTGGKGGDRGSICSSGSTSADECDDEVFERRRLPLLRNPRDETTS